MDGFRQHADEIGRGIYNGARQLIRGTHGLFRRQDAPIGIINEPIGVVGGGYGMGGTRLIEQDIPQRHHVPSTYEDDEIHVEDKIEDFNPPYELRHQFFSTEKSAKGRGEPAANPKIVNNVYQENNPGFPLKVMKEITDKKRRNTILKIDDLEYEKDIDAHETHLKNKARRKLVDKYEK